MTPPDFEDVLSAFRADIDRVDREILARIAERRALVERLFDAKRANAKPLTDDTRERALIDDRATRGAVLGIPDGLTRAVFRAILDDSRARATRDGDR